MVAALLPHLDEWNRTVDNANLGKDLSKEVKLLARHTLCRAVVRETNVRDLVRKDDRKALTDILKPVFLGCGLSKDKGHDHMS